MEARQVTNPTLERAARAAWEYMESREADGLTTDSIMVGAARAVLMAVREPDEAMQRAFWSSPNTDGYNVSPPGLPDERGSISQEQEWYGTGAQFRAGFTAMIDAILAECET